MKKGFVISFDALIAILVLLTMVVVATSYFGKARFEAGSSLALKGAAMDAITVLEKSGKLEEALADNKSSPVRPFLNRLAYNLCVELRAYPETDLNNHSLLVLRPGCKRNFGDLATAKRSIFVEEGSNPGFYLAELDAWYRVNE